MHAHVGIGAKLGQCRRVHESLFVQDAPDLVTLERQIQRITSDSDFQRWTKKVLPLLRQSPNREIYLVVKDGSV